MAKNIYVAGAEQNSGKSAIVLAMMEYLSGHSGKIGFFRPVIVDEPTADALTHLIATRYPLTQSTDSLFGCTQDIAREYLADNRYDDLVKLILAKYQDLAKHCDIILCAGTDFKSAGVAIEFDFNIDIANNLGCFIIPVVRGKDRSLKQVLAATASFHQLLAARDADILTTIINRVDPGLVDQITSALAFTDASKQCCPTYVVPNVSSLSQPTVADIARALEANHVYSSTDTLNRVIDNYKIAAMSIADYLTYIAEGSLIMTPADRADIILSTLLSYSSSTYPQVAGLLLTGNTKPHSSVQQLLQGLENPPFAILSVSSDTFSTAMAVSSISVELTPENERKIATTLGITEANIDWFALGKRIESFHSTRVTPLMFEYALIQSVKARKRHIVLPEGNEERILRATEILLLRGVCDLTKMHGKPLPSGGGWRVHGL